MVVALNGLLKREAATVNFIAAHEANDVRAVLFGEAVFVLEHIAEHTGPAVVKGGVALAQEEQRVKRSGLGGNDFEYEYGANKSKPELTMRLKPATTVKTPEYLLPDIPGFLYVITVQQPQHTLPRKRNNTMHWWWTRKRPHRDP